MKRGAGGDARRAEGRRAWHERGRAGRLTAELKSFEPPDGIALIRNNLSLPEKSDGHQAHGDYANGEHDSHAGFRSRDVKLTDKPSHVRDLLVLGRLSSDFMRSTERAIGGTERPLPTTLKAIIGPRRGNCLELLSRRKQEIWGFRRETRSSAKDWPCGKAGT